MYFCAACKLYVKDGGVAEHDQSTAHLLSVTKAPTLRKGASVSVLSTAVHRIRPLMRCITVTVWLPESNRGYKLLLGMGWQENAGLGPNGDGRVTPVATTFKTDRAGIGSATQAAPRVTHFPPHDEQQAARAVDGKSEAQRAQERLARKRKTEAKPSSSSSAAASGSRKAQRRDEQARDRALHRELYSEGLEGYEQYLR